MMYFQIFDGITSATFNIPKTNVISGTLLAWHFRVYPLSGNYLPVNLEVFGCSKYLGIYSHVYLSMAHAWYTQFKVTGKNFKIAFISSTSDHFPPK